MHHPIYWIIDDDISFSATIEITEKQQEIHLFDIINQHLGKIDALIGSISCDPPVPTLSCMRGQLIDFLHSHQAKKSINADFLKIKSKPDYYYDLSDSHSDHLESPIYHTKISENDLKYIFSGKSLSRQALQRNESLKTKTITKRGANTLVFNRDLLQRYPVINIEVHHKFARRGDLLWALLNQLVSEKKIIEHPFALDHNRPIIDFNVENELEKAAYDIIGYAFNKAFLNVIDAIKEQTKATQSKDIFEQLNQKHYYQQFLNTYYFYLNRRKIRFLMNYYRIIGVLKLLSEDFKIAKSVYNQVSNKGVLTDFNTLIEAAQNEDTLTVFFNELTTTISTYTDATTDLNV